MNDEGLFPEAVALASHRGTYKTEAGAIRKAAGFLK